LSSSPSGPGPVYEPKAISTSVSSTSYRTEAKTSCKDQGPIAASLKAQVVDLTQLEYRRQFIANMTREAWSAYSRHAWGQYDLQPLSLGKQEAWLEYSGQSLVGAMSTLWIMGLKEEFEQGRKWIEKEMIIDDRSLTKVGSLLSVYALSGDALFKNKAREIADLYNPTDLNSRTENSLHRTLILGEWMKQRLEYPYLSNITNERKYVDRVKQINYFFNEQNDLKPIDENDKMNWMIKVKAYIQSKGRDVQDLSEYYAFIDSLEKNGYLRQTKSGLWYVRELLPMNYMNSWYCHFGAMLALGQFDKLQSRLVDAWQEDVQELKRTVRHLDMAKQITELCHISTKWTETGLPPLKFFVDEESTADSHNQEVFCWKDKCQSESRAFALNPQLAESYFVLYRLTKEEKYREYAWDLARAIHKHCRTKNGYAQVRDVMEMPTKKEDSQPPVFLSATLKYLYLTFAADDLLPLDQWVFNADGQPLPVCEAYPECAV
jgi:mannosyl-oligosaccharide alpha-1,2-mannosidase